MELKRLSRCGDNDIEKRLSCSNLWANRTLRVRYTKLYVKKQTNSTEATCKIRAGGFLNSWKIAVVLYTDLRAYRTNPSRKSFLPQFFTQPS